MKAVTKPDSFLSRLRFHAWRLALLWTGCVAGSLLWNLHEQAGKSLEMARNSAQLTFENDVLYRRWAARQGGVYVAVSEHTSPNPYLKVPNRDVTTTSGLSLTLVNPAYMARLVHELGGEVGGTRGHITSLRPVRPENKPDAWEAAALRAFEKGVPAVSSVQRMDGGEYLRLMRPFVTETACLKCHAAQGYKEGDIRGGISVSVPMAPLRTLEKSTAENLVLAHMGLWLIGLAGIGVSKRRLGKQILARERAEADLRASDELARQRLTEIEDLYRSAPVGLCELDRDLRYVRINDRMAEMNGLPAAQHLGRTVREVVPGLADATEPAFRRILETGQPVLDHEVRGETAAQPGIRRTWIESWLPLRNAAGHITGISVVAEEITARKQAEEKLQASRAAAINLMGDAVAARQESERAGAQLRESEERLRVAHRHGGVGVWGWNVQTGELNWEAEAEQLYGLVPGTLRTYADWASRVHPGDLARIEAERDAALARREGFQVEFRIQHASGQERWIAAKGRADYDPAGRMLRVLGLNLDITERKQAEREQQVAADFLRLVNQSRGTADLVRVATGYLQELTGCQAVGVRLEDGDDYPYYETRGFPREFVRAENQLCTRGADGQAVLDAAGNPVLDCMCGNVICGRFDSTKPFFTAGGSFWTNCTTELLAGTTDADRQARTRNRCNGEGYESVALIPLRSGQARIGLLQLNDRRKGRFSPESIALWERLAGYLAVALAKSRAEDDLRRSNKAMARLNEAMVGRELRMVDLKQEINALCAQLGQPPRYAPGCEKDGRP